MYYELEYLYELFDKKNFKLFKKEINSKEMQLDFCSKDNIIDKFSIIFNNNIIETIVPLQKYNSSYKTKINTLEETIEYIRLHLEIYSNNLL